MGRRQLPIDKGWAWVITFASCGIFGFITGAQKVRGLILVELQEKFPEASTTLLLWVLSLNILFDRLLGPVNGMILARTSHRTLSIMGSCIMTASLVAFAYSPSIEYMFVAYSVYGWGTGMNSLSCMTAYQPYFDKRKALSLGITGSGSGVGTLVLSAVLRLLFDNFSFSGAMLLHAGICMQTLILASLLRPFSFYDRCNEPEKNLPSTDMQDRDDTTTVQESHIMGSLPVEKTREESSPLQTEIAHISSTSNNLNGSSTNQHHSDKNNLSNGQILALSAQDISTSGVILEENTAKHSNAGDEKGWRLVYHPRCILLGISIVLHISAMMASYPCIPPYGVESGVSKQLISILLAGAGGLEIPMRIINGWLADKNLMTAYNQLTLCMFITSVTALLCAILSGTAGIALILIGLSSTGTSVFTLLPVACGELFGAKNVRTAMSILFVYQGVSIFLASFNSGAIYDSTQRWQIVFYYVSASMAAAGTIMLVTAAVAHCMDKRKHS